MDKYKEFTAGKSRESSRLAKDRQDSEKESADLERHTKNHDKYIEKIFSEIKEEEQRGGSSVSSSNIKDFEMTSAIRKELEKRGYTIIPTNSGIVVSWFDFEKLSSDAKEQKYFPYYG